MLHTDDLIRDTEKNIAAGCSDDFTDLFKYAYNKGKAETFEDCIAIIRYEFGECEYVADYLESELKKQNND